jgi:sugar (pentulose or hexulose) kinase
LSRHPVTLIFDIGKTTKKTLVFDSSFHVLEEQTTTFKEIVDDDGFPGEDLQQVSDWVLEVFSQYAKHPAYEVTQCNFSSYGASLVHLDQDGKRIDPFINYLKPLPPHTRELFDSLYGPEKKISAITASPFLGMLNSGLQLFWLKHEKPDRFRIIHTSLHLPQYFTYLLTGKTFTDITSVGCHTMLWDFQKQAYHQWVIREEIAKFFPPIQRADHTFVCSLHNRLVKVGVGVHDSSASLMPYLATQKEPFLLLSTGTWNICFNPFNNNPLTPEELSADCLCFLTFESKPVKASRIFLGHEHEIQEEALCKFFNVPSDYYKSVTFDESLYQKLDSLPATKKVFFPMGMEGTGPIPEKQSQQTDFSAFENFEEAYHQLVRYLVKWQMLSIQLLDPGKKVNNVIVVGGFTKSPLFIEMLKRDELKRKILISDHPRASALGAAWLVAGKEAYSGNAGLLSVSEA